MIELFKRYVGWKVLAHFLVHPGTSFYIKELSRLLGISPASASAAVKAFHRDGLLLKEEKGQTHLYCLDPEHPVVPPLREAYGRALVLSTRPGERFLEKDSGIISLALYGSFADGTFDEESDVDLLAVTSGEREAFLEPIRGMEEGLGREVSLTVLRLDQWRVLAKKEDAFYRRVTENHVVLYGSGIE